MEQKAHPLSGDHRRNFLLPGLVSAEVICGEEPRLRPV